jgi:uncharacterized membrane-anchored protein
MQRRSPETWNENRRGLAKAAPIFLLVCIAAGIGAYPDTTGAGAIVGAVLGAVVGIVFLVIVYYVARHQWAKAPRNERVGEWYDLISGLLVAFTLLALSLLLLIVGNLLDRIVGVLGTAFAIGIASPRLAELQRRARRGAGGD